MTASTITYSLHRGTAKPMCFASTRRGFVQAANGYVTLARRYAR